MIECQNPKLRCKDTKIFSYMQARELFLYFFSKIFGYVKKKL